MLKSMGRTVGSDGEVTALSGAVIGGIDEYASRGLQFDGFTDVDVALFSSLS